MPAWLQRVVDVLREGWGQPVTLFLAILFCTVVTSWAWNRGFRAADRGALMQPLLVIMSFGTALLLSYMKDHLHAAIIVSVGMLVAALLARNERVRAPWIPMMILAALLGLDLKLSAAVFLVGCALLFGLSPVTKR
jgi:hypothetical protein